MTRNLLRTGAINLAILALLALAALAGAEIYLRLTVPASSGDSIFQYTLETRRYKVMKPNASVVAWGRELRTNELGFRDDAPVLPPKQKGEFRIIVLGDSMTVSAGVDFGDIFTTLLEKRLRRSHPEVRVINLAVGGYNMVQYALVLEEVGLGLEPDLILIGLSADNDFALDTYELNRRVASGQEPPSALAWHESLYVYRAFLGRIVARIERMLDKGQRPGQAPDAAWERNVAALRSILQAARARGVPVMAAVLPQNWNWQRQRPLFAQIEAICRAHDLRCVNLLERFITRGIPESSLRLNAVDAHPNEKYNAVVAEELAPHLSAALQNRQGVQYAGFPARLSAPDARQ